MTRAAALVRELYAIQNRLREAFPDRRFSLDGKLVGDLGEVIAAERYGLELEDNPSTNVDDAKLEPDAIAETYLAVLNQHRSAWSQEIDLRPWKESF